MFVHCNLQEKLLRVTWPLVLNEILEDLVGTVLNKELSTRVFETRTVIERELFSLLTCLHREQTDFSKTNRMAVNRLKNHTGRKKHSAKVR